MSIADAFMALVAAGLGALLLAVAVRNWEPFFQLPKAAWLARHLGRVGARAVLALLGLVMLATTVILVARAAR